MNAGDKFRKETDRDNALALLALDNVRRFRKKQDSDSARIPRQAYLFRSLKRPEEVSALRRVYGSNLVVISDEVFRLTANGGQRKQLELGSHSRQDVVCVLLEQRQFGTSPCSNLGRTSEGFSMKVMFKVGDQLLARVRNDLGRLHEFAAERVGFIACRAASLVPGGIVILAHEYKAVGDEEYIDDRTVGAMMGSNAIRKALEFPGRLEREPEALCLDCHCGIHRSEAIALSADLGNDSAGLHSTASAKGETLSCPVIFRTLH